MHCCPYCDSGRCRFQSSVRVLPSWTSPCCRACRCCQELARTLTHRPPECQAPRAPSMTEGGRIFRSTRRRVPSSRMSACQPRPRASPQRLPGQGGWLLAAAACAALCCPSSAFIAPSRSPLSATSSRLEAGTSRGAGAWLVRPAGARPVSSAALSLRCNGEPRLPVGRITTLDRSKISTDSDSVFYAAPRLVTHADEAWITQLQALYRQRIKTGARVLDLMSSHVSHIPVEVSCSRVDVHGMNEEELCNNPAMQATGGSVFVHDLNREPSLPFAGECEYDAVLCALGVQYLEQAEMVFAEAGRVLAPDGVVIVSFSSNFFYEKALTGWIERGMQGRSRLVKDYLRAAGGFAEIEELGPGGGVWGTLASILPGNAAGDPFAAVVAVRSTE